MEPIPLPPKAGSKIERKVGRPVAKLPAKPAPKPTAKPIAAGGFWPALTVLSNGVEMGGHVGKFDSFEAFWKWQDLVEAFGGEGAETDQFKDWLKKLLKGDKPISFTYATTEAKIDDTYIYTVVSLKALTKMKMNTLAYPGEVEVFIPGEEEEEKEEWVEVEGRPGFSVIINQPSITGAVLKQMEAEKSGYSPKAMTLYVGDQVVGDDDPVYPIWRDTDKPEIRIDTDVDYVETSPNKAKIQGSSGNYDVDMAPRVYAFLLKQNEARKSNEPVKAMTLYVGDQVVGNEKDVYPIWVRKGKPSIRIVVDPNYEEEYEEVTDQPAQV